MDLVRKYGKSWSKISKMLGTRNGKQIRDRFINVLDNEVKKGKFTDEEDRKLILLFKQYGPKWASIAKYYPNRTADMIKNRFHSSIKKKITSEEGCEKFDFSKEIENLSKHDTADDSNKSLINLSQHYNNSVLNYTQSIESESLLQDFESFEQRNTDFYQMNQPINNNFQPFQYNNFALNYDLVNMNAEVKPEEVNMLPNLWNFEDYFTI
jgi:myb proto-oncogene protein